MWGIRAIRIAMLLCGCSVIIAGSGCCSDCHSLWDLTKSLKDDKKEKESDTAPKWNAETGQWEREPQPSRLTPERVHGGIY